jgi:hypothetical protein
LLNPVDIGMESDARAYIQLRYDPQGGIEVRGTEDELCDLECLFDSPDCVACRLDDRFFILPHQGMYEALVARLKACVCGRSSYCRKRVIEALKVARRVLLWPYYYISYICELEARIQKLPWQTIAVVYVLRFVPALIGVIVRSLLFAGAFHPFVILVAYLLGGAGLFLGNWGIFAPKKAKNKDANIVEYETFPLTDAVIGFLLAAVLQILW